MKQRLTLFVFVCFFSKALLFGQFTFTENWKARTFSYPAAVVPKALNSSGSPNAIINIDISSKLSLVLPTQFGANFPFRNGADQRSRSSIYNGVVTSMRFPAGSGSNTYFWDGNVPASLSDYIDQSGNVQTVSGIKGTNSNYMTPQLFVQFKQDISGEPIVVVNYFYARYGRTATGTRADRVQQAADYAAEFVRKMNITLGANIKYWEIGNECYGKWEAGYNVNDPNIGIVTGTEYGEDFCVFAQAMKAIDPAIKIGAVVEDEDNMWNSQVLPKVKNAADFLSVHEYFTTVNQANNYNNILNSVGQINTINNNIKNCIIKYTGKPADYYPIALTEFNSRGAYNCSMINGVFIAQILGEIITNKIGYASLWVSEWNWSDTDQESKGFLAKGDLEQEDYTARQAFVPFYYYSKCFGDYLVNSSSTHTDVKSYASTFSSGEIGITLINTSSAVKTAKLIVKNGTTDVVIDQAYWYEFYANTIDLTQSYKKFYVNGMTSSTTGGGPDLTTVNPYQTTYLGDNVFTMPPYSVYFIVLKTLNAETSNCQIQKETRIIPFYIHENTLTIKKRENLIGFEIFGMDGKNVYKTNSYECSVANLSKGIYVLRAKYKEGIIASMFSK